MNKWIIPALLVVISVPALAQDKPAKPSAPVKPPVAPLPPAMQEHAHDDAEDDDAPPPKDETALDYFWRRSDAAFHAGDYPHAIQLHRGIQALDPHDVESYGIAAWLSWSLGNKDDAHAFINSGLKNNADDPEMWDTAGQQYDLEKAAPQARDSYKKAVELAGKEAPELLRRRLAHAAEHANDYPLALTTWRDLVRDFPASDVNKNNLARAEKAAVDAQKTPTAQISATAFAGGVVTASHLAWTKVPA